MRYNIERFRKSMVGLKKCNFSRIDKFRCTLWFIQVFFEAPPGKKYEEMDLYQQWVYRERWLRAHPEVWEKVRKARMKGMTKEQKHDFIMHEWIRAKRRMRPKWHQICEYRRKHVHETLEWIKDITGRSNPVHTPQYSPPTPTIINNTTMNEHAFQIQAAYQKTVPEFTSFSKQIDYITSTIPEVVKGDIWLWHKAAAFIIAFTLFSIAAYLIAFYIASIPSFLRYLKCIHAHFPCGISPLSFIVLSIKKFAHRVGFYKTEKGPKKHLKVLFWTLWELKTLPLYSCLTFLFMQFINIHFIHAVYMTKSLEGLTAAQIESIKNTFHFFTIPLDTIDPFCWIFLLIAAKGAILGVFIGCIIGLYKGQKIKIFDSGVILVSLEHHFLHNPVIANALSEKNLHIYRYSREVYDTIYKCSPFHAKVYDVEHRYYTQFFKRHRRLMGISMIGGGGFATGLIHPITDRHMIMLQTELKELYDHPRPFWEHRVIPIEAHMDVMRTNMIYYRRKIYFYLHFLDKTPDGNKNLDFDYQWLRIWRKKFSDKYFCYVHFVRQLYHRHKDGF